MIGKGRLETKDEIRKELKEILYGPYFGKKNNTKLTSKGIKLTLTKWIKQTEEYYTTISAIYKNPPNSRYYLGDFVYSWMVINTKRELEILKELREEA